MELFLSILLIGFPFNIDNFDNEHVNYLELAKNITSELIHNVVNAQVKNPSEINFTNDQITLLKIKLDELKVIDTNFENNLIEWVNQHSDWKPNVKNFTSVFLENGLIDRPITRDINWGIPIPLDGYEDKRIYVWFEAVIGYLSASKEWAKNNGNEKEWAEWWNNESAETYYFIGKDNVPFHAVIWPSILLAYEGLNLPTNVPANQYILVKGEKASASRGVGKTLQEYLDQWNPDALRYALASALPEQSDTEISEDEMIRRNNEELVAAWGNLVQRVFTQIQNNFSKISEIDEKDEFRNKVIDEYGLGDLGRGEGDE